MLEKLKFQKINLSNSQELQNSAPENTTIISSDYSYDENSNVYVEKGYDHWKDKKKNSKSNEHSAPNNSSENSQKFKVFIPQGVEGLPKKCTPVAIYPCKDSDLFDSALATSKTLNMKKLSVSKHECIVWELQLPKDDPRFLGFQTKSNTAINILATKFSLNEIEKKKLENDIVALSSTKNISDCVTYLFLDICLKHENINSTAMKKQPSYNTLIKNAESANQHKSR